MKKILGLDPGIASVGWAVVQMAEKASEKSGILDAGVVTRNLTVRYHRLARSMNCTARALPYRLTWCADRHARHAVGCSTISNAVSSLLSS